MRKTSQNSYKKKSVIPKKNTITQANNLYQHAFENSLQANLVSSIQDGKIIMANSAACKLLGYSKKTLLNKTIQSIFIVKENNYKKLLKERTTAGSSVALLSALKSGKKAFTCQVSSAVFIDMEGISRSITTIEDMSQSITRQHNIDIKKEQVVAANIILARSGQKKIDAKNKKIVGDNIVLAKSKQKKIDTQNEKIVSDNIVLAKSKQKKIDTQKEKIVSDNIVLARSKQKKIDIKKEKIVSDNIVLAKSKQKKIDTKKEKIVSDNILLASAKAEEEKLVYENYGRKKVLIEIEENFRLIFNSSSDVLFDSHIATDILKVNEAYEKEFGHKTSETMGASGWSTHIHPDDKKAVMQDYQRMLLSYEVEWKCGYRFLRADQTVANVLSSRIILREPDGKAYRMIGSMQDISKQKVLEEKLENEIRLKEVQIAEAAEDAKHTERSDIGKELHDNVNQLLGASKLYLELAKRGGENSEMHLNRSSEYTLAAIEEIRKLTKGLTTDIIKNLGLCEAIETIAHDTMETNPLKISCLLTDFKETSVNDKFKLNLFRIIQEQLNNILKHARATRVRISLLQNKRSIRLTISDNGIGFDTGKKQKGIGLSNIRSRTESYQGTADFVSNLGKGCVLTATFPSNNKLLIRA